MFCEKIIEHENQNPPPCIPYCHVMWVCWHYFHYINTDIPPSRAQLYSLIKLLSKYRYSTSITQLLSISALQWGFYYLGHLPPPIYSVTCVQGSEPLRKKHFTKNFKFVKFSGLILCNKNDWFVTFFRKKFKIVHLVAIWRFNIGKIAVNHYKNFMRNNIFIENFMLNSESKT